MERAVAVNRWQRAKTWWGRWGVPFGMAFVGTVSPLAGAPALLGRDKPVAAGALTLAGVLLVVQAVRMVVEIRRLERARVSAMARTAARKAAGR